MTTLRIEHAITDFDVWKGAFDRFADARERAGVQGCRIHQPVYDTQYVLIDLDFDGEEQATTFLGFLRDQVWGHPGNAPALVGEPKAGLLHQKA